MILNYLNCSILSLCCCIHISTFPNIFIVIFFNYFKSMSEIQIDQDLDKLVQEELSHLLDDVSTDNTGEEERIISSNVYYDKQLSHLVVTE